jgi:hypothetical protein
LTALAAPKRRMSMAPLSEKPVMRRAGARGAPARARFSTCRRHLADGAGGTADDAAAIALPDRIDSGDETAARVTRTASTLAGSNSVYNSSSLRTSRARRGHHHAPLHPVTASGRTPPDADGLEPLAPLFCRSQRLILFREA